ncbi:MAG: Hpt domain-containing protein [Campylobacterota bacterium]|nr:Hpt domain-containing protein [Campylobacterota bacterium]
MDFGIEQNIFYDEVMNKLNCLEDALEQAKHGTEDKEIINEIFRAIHTVKGVADLLGFFDIVKLTHKAEDLLDEIREGKVSFTHDIYYIFFELKRFISELVDDALNGIEMDDERSLVYDSFLLELNKHMPKTILVLDMNSKMLNYINNFAKESNYKILTKVSTDDVLEVLKKENINLFICDIQNSRYLSMNLIKEIKSQIKYKDLPIIISIDKVKKDLKTVGEIIGASAWIKKPYDKNKFCNTIKNVLNNKPPAL